MTPGVPSYGGETYVDNWMNYFDRPSEMFNGGHDFSPEFISSDATGYHLSSSPQYYPAATPATTMPPMPSMPLDPNLTENHHAPYESQSTQPGAALHALRSDLLGYENEEIQSSIADMDPRMMATLENFARLSTRQQQHILEQIRKKRSQFESSGMEGSMDIRFLGCHILSAPPGKVNPAQDDGDCCKDAVVDMSTAKTSY